MCCLIEVVLLPLVVDIKSTLLSISICLCVRCPHTPGFISLLGAVPPDPPSPFHLCHSKVALPFSPLCEVSLYPLIRLPLYVPHVRWAVGDHAYGLCCACSRHAAAPALLLVAWWAARFHAFRRAATSALLLVGALRRNRRAAAPAPRWSGDWVLGIVPLLSPQPPRCGSGPLVGRVPSCRPGVVPFSAVAALRLEQDITNCRIQMEKDETQILPILEILESGN